MVNRLSLERLCAAVAVALSVGVCFSADDPAASSIVTSHEIAQKNPTTEIAVDFGDVSHLSPWRVKRRHPRTGGERGGQLITLREALDALNVYIAKDDEMPEHTFKFDDDGALVSVCDVPFGDKASDGDTSATSVRFIGHDEKTVLHSLDSGMLAKPVRDYNKIVFTRVVKKPASAVAADAASRAADKNVVRKNGDAKTITLPGGAKMEMLWCEPGTFMMGSPLTEIGRFDDEPIHPVTLTKGFWLGKYEVTQRQWESVMGENKSRFKNPNGPVDNVSWDDCQKFIGKVNAALGGIARLPTEAEWEYACRAGSAQAVSGSGLIGDMAWYDANSGNQTHEVGKNQANAWGFYDMHGNVLEWCMDWFSKAEGQAVDPKGPATGSFRVLRGGCWFFYERDCRSAYRLKRDPGIRNCIFGFRMACDGKGAE